MLHSLTTSSAADQALAWLLTYAVHSTLLLTMAWAVSRGLGGRRLRLQETIWRCALLGALVTASAQLAIGQLGHVPVAGRWTLASSGAPVAVSADATNAAHAAHAAVVAHASGDAGEAYASEPVPAPETSVAAGGATLATLARPPFEDHAAAAHGAGMAQGEGGESRHGFERAWTPLRPLLLPAWLLGALALILGYVRSHLALRQRLRYRPQVVGGGVLARLAGLVRKSGISRRVRLTCTWRLRVPVALGLRSAEVCVPPRALFQLDDEQQDALLAHELAHLARRDPVWLPITQLLVAFFFFQPLNWLARRRLRELSELLCDEWAIARTGRPLSLAGCLAEVAGWSLGGPGADTRPRHPARLPVPGMADRPSQLAHRIRRLLDGAPLAPGEPMEGRGPARRHLAVLMAAVLLAVTLAAPGVSADSSPAPGVAPADAAACASYSAVGRGVAPGVAAVCAGSTVAAAAGDAPEDGAVASTFDDPGGADSGFVLDSRPSPIEAGAASRGADSSNGHGPAGHASMKMAALAPAEAQEHEAAAAPAPAPDSPSGAAVAPLLSGSPASSSVAVEASGASTEPAAGSASGAGSARDAAPRARADELDAERERLAAAAARLAQLDKISTLSQEQIAAITAAVERISRDVDGRLGEQLEHLNHQLAGTRAALAHQADLPAAELAELGAKLAGMAAQLHPSPKEMAEIGSELRKLAAEQPHLSAEEIKRIQEEAMRGLQQLPNLGLTKAEIDRLHAEVKRSLEEMPKLALSQADLDHLRSETKRVIEESEASHALSLAERDKIVADARRLAKRLRPDQAQREALRALEHDREELTRALAEQRAEIEAMRREIQQQTEALRAQGHRLSDSHRTHPKAKPAEPRRHAPSRSSASPADSAAPGNPPDTAPPAAEPPPLGE